MRQIDNYGDYRDLLVVRHIKMLKAFNSVAYSMCEFNQSLDREFDKACVESDIRRTIIKEPVRIGGR